MLPEWIKTAAAVISVALSIIAMLIARRDRTTDAQRRAWRSLEERLSGDKTQIEERHRVIDARMGDIGRSLAVIQERLDHVPDKDEIGDLYRLIREVNSAVGGLSTAVGEVRGQQTALTRTVDLINQYLMGEKRR